ncbi:hypothetical protein BC830DRAFT_1145380 [Chytriomyces sp. MP71]|nr:hypothetical protein BC830DRAFT_1145380 [Chytriomyces sp. MP71]
MPQFEALGAPFETGRTKGELSNHRVKRSTDQMPAYQEIITRSLDEATSIMTGYRERITSGEIEFAKLATTESDCSYARAGGDLGFFGPGQMQKAFEDGTYALHVGKLSQLVYSDSGVHLILRTA